MRDLMFLAGFLVLLPMAFGNAMVAWLIWGWTAIIAIDNYLFGFMQSLRINLIFGIIALTIILLKRDTTRGCLLNNSATFILIACFLAQITISAIFAYDGNTNNWVLYERFIKGLIFALVMPLVVVGRYRIHAVVIMLCLGLGFHGLIDGLKFLSSGGSHMVQGFIKFGDNNHFAVILVMIIPLLLYLSRYSSNKLARLAALFAAFTNIAAIIGTHSRGGLVALLATGAWMIIGTRQRLSGIMLFGAGLALVVALAPSKWTERMDTIQTADQDMSFMTRVEAWQVSSAIALSNPLTGGGLHSVQMQYVWEMFRGSKGLLPFIDVGFVSDRLRAAHSIYFEVLGDTGFIGFFLFLAILLNGIWNSRRLAIVVKGREQEFEWALDLSRALTAVIFGFMVGGLTVSLAYSEIIYVVIMLTEVLRREVTTAVSQTQGTMPRLARLS